MKLGRVLIASMFLGLSPAYSEDTPPYAVHDPAIMENFRRIYATMDKHTHDGIDSAKLTVFKSSNTAAQFTGYSLTFGSSTLAGGASVSIAPIAVTSLFLPNAWVLNSASYTLKVDDWITSFTVTNTGTLTQRFGWSALTQ